MKKSFSLPAFAAQDPSFRQFAAKASNHRVLSKEEEHERIRAAQGGDAKAMDFLIRHNVRMLLTLIAKHGRAARYYDVTPGELFSVASLAMMEAIGRFETERGHRLSTYATHWIRARIWQEFARHGATIRQSGNVTKGASSISRYKQRFYAEHGRMPDDQEIVAGTGMGLARVRHVQERHLERPLSLHTVVNTRGGVNEHPTYLIDVIPDESADLGNRDEDDVYQERALQALAAAKERLQPAERFILDCRFKADSDEELSLVATSAALAEKFGGRPVSRERIRQLQERAKEKLAKALLQHYVQA